jgi:DNA processing protein
MTQLVGDTMAVKRTLRRYQPPVATEVLTAEELGFSADFKLKYPLLYAAGDLSLLSRPAVAIVGSRKATPEGLKRARQLARALTEAGIVIMSGLADGIDQAAHRAALELGGATIAVIGTPLDKAYPAAHAELQERIYREQLLLSPFAVGTRTFPSHFTQRNQVMARLAAATVIIEASDTSGTLHQAAECERSGRPLLIARSVVDDPKLTWPKRFSGATTLDNVNQVLQAIA